MASILDTPFGGTPIVGTPHYYQKQCRGFPYLGGLNRFLQNRSSHITLVSFGDPGSERLEGQARS